MASSGYDAARICLNGHIISTSVHDFPESSTPFCAQCGAATVTGCQACGVEIRGYYRGSMSTSYDRPSFCASGRGSPYPWTVSALDSLHELAQEADMLTPEEQALLSRSFDDLLRAGVSTEVAAVRVKRFLPRVGTELGGAMKSILINVVTDAVKRQLGL
jgi:hypothetical protein